MRLPDTEARLCQLARWVVDADGRGERYGLELPGTSIPADSGPEHRHRCLAALARFGSRRRAGGAVNGAARRPAPALLWACAAFAGGVLLHIDRVPAWAGATALALVAWRLWSARTRAWLPPSWLRAVLALSVTGIVLARFHTLNGLTAGTTLLMLMAALKLLEGSARATSWC